MLMLAKLLMMVKMSMKSLDLDMISSETQVAPNVHLGWDIYNFLKSPFILSRTMP